MHTTLKKNPAAAENTVAAQILVAPTLTKVAHITLDKIAIKDDKREEEPTLLHTHISPNQSNCKNNHHTTLWGVLAPTWRIVIDGLRAKFGEDTGEDSSLFARVDTSEEDEPSLSLTS